MKILVCGMNYAPELTGIGKYSGEMAEWLARQGHEVRFVAAPPYYPEWKVHAGYSPMSYRYEEINGVGVWRCPVYVPGRPSGFKRIVHLLSFALSSLPVMLRHACWRPDVVVTIEPPLFCAPASWLTARLSGAQCWLHVQDFEVDAAFALGLLSSARVRGLVLFLESWLMRRFDRVSSISGSMVRRLTERRVDSTQAVLFQNWSDLETIKHDASGAAAFRRKHHIAEQTFLALYSGNMGEKQGLEMVLQAAESLQHEDILFVLCGEGAARNTLMARAENMRNVLFLDLQPLHELPAMLSAANVHLIVQKADAADLVMPSKLTNIVAVGGRSIATAAPESELGQLYRRQPYLGYLCRPGELSDFIACITACKQEVRSVYHPEIRSYAEQHLAKEAILDRFEETLAPAGRSDH